MTLGIFLLLIFILYLIDKHKLWKRAAKISIWFVVISLLSLGGIYAWRHHVDAENDAYKAKMKPIWDCEARNAQFSTNAEAECTRNPEIVLAPNEAMTNAQPLDPNFDYFKLSDGSYAKFAKGTSREAMRQKLVAHGLLKPETQRPTRLVKALLDTSLKTTELGELTCGHIKAGETATLLLDGGYGWVKVKTADGQMGWADASQFEVVRSANK